MFKKIDPKLNQPELEEKILKFWEENKIFDKSLEKNKNKENFVFFEGPPTANGKPGLHHVEARSFKDLYPRYKTMKGFNVTRKAGWDTHGLPVELEVEKSLGISGKGQIENLVRGDKKASIEKFNKLCKESVWKYKSEWEELTRRMGFWVDMSNPYVTYDAKYIESVWWVIGEINKKGLLYKGHKVVPYCPRCGTALSSHEVAQGYQKITEESVYIKIKSKKEDVYFLVWTTTPWTLSGNAALAFGPGIKYVLAEKDSTKYILAKNRAEKLLGPDVKILNEMTGAEVVSNYSTANSDYEPLYPEGEKFSEAGEKAYKLINADYVSDTDGAGIVHIAPAFGEDDYISGFQKSNIKVLKTVNEKGESLAGPGTGNFVKDADLEIKLDLEERGLLFRKEQTSHDYPFCWRCNSPLLYFAKDSWYIAMSKLREELLKNNETINWIPDYLKHGRFGNWLENINDWAISRDRYWGTPLPVWECEKCHEIKVVTSLKEIGDIEPHKPFVDEVTFDCPKCAGTMKRTSEVMDVWLDSGTMPFSQWHYPFENEETFKSQYPADFIAEAIDQTRGWFYTMLAISTILMGNSSYKNVISLGHLLDEKGKKMSKSKGNIIFPHDVFASFGADVARIFFYSVNQPGDPKLYSDKEMTAISRNLFLTLWNVYSFFMTYASIDNFEPKGTVGSENLLDKWIVAKLQKLVNEVTESLDKYDAYKSSNSITEFVTELSTWYVRRSRRRFWKSENDSDKIFAYETLYYVLKELSKVIAPFAPFYAEELYSGLRLESDSESVHLESYPEMKEYDKEILASMETARKVVELGLSERAANKIKVRQPLQSITYHDKKLNSELEQIITEEVNVKQVNFAEGDINTVKLDINISKELQLEGLARELVRNIQSLRKKANFDISDRITLNYATDSDLLKEVFESQKDLIAKEVLAESVSNKKAEVETSEELNIDGEKIWVGIKRK